MPSGSVAISVTTLRELFRNLQAFRAAFEDDGIEEITAPDGTTWCLWDVEYLYREALPLLPQRQWQAIELCLVRNYRESDAALAMGVSKTNPVAMYATLGLEKIVSMIEDDRFPRFRPYEEDGWHRCATA